MEKLPHVQRMEAELSELTERTEKLHDFFGTNLFASLPAPGDGNLSGRSAMSDGPCGSGLTGVPKQDT